MTAAATRSWKSVQNKTERFTGKEFLEAVDFMRTVKKKYTQLELAAKGPFNRYSVAGWYNSGVIPKNEVLARLKEMMNDTP